MNNSQIINAALIITGGCILVYTISADDVNPYFKIIGLVIIMLGLYRATNYWVATKDDHKHENNDKEE